MAYEYICPQCGGPRSYGSAKRCRKCYLENAAFKREGPFEKKVMKTLLQAESDGIFVQTPDGWTLPEFAPDGDCDASTK